ncbi:MAG: S8 family serine peptidase [Solirubrobacteraceae bacterium]|nr:S8 family serine peptidase [Solirubrobacteraceae bacterium]
MALRRTPALVAGLAAATALPLLVAGAHANTAAPAAASTSSGLAATAAPAVRDRELLVRFKATGQLQRVKVGAGQDPVALAKALRTRTDLFKTVGANLIATAAGSRATGAQEVATTPTTPAATTPAPTTPAISVPASAALAPPSGLKGWIPNDHVGDIGWTSLQWNFVGRWGVKATEAWDVLRRRSSATAGGNKVKVAVVDSGLAYRDAGAYRRSPDIDPSRVLPGYDFVDQDRFPDDESGHGTHVASTIAADTDNDTGLTGLAYRAQIVPIRVLDDRDSGDVLAIARGIRYAIRREVDLINLSVDFPVTTTAADIPEVIDAVDAARRAGILVVSSSGNDGTSRLAYPARAASVLAVGATTARGCRSTFSNSGSELALVAPGGGTDHSGDTKGRCEPGQPAPPIAQITLMRPGTTTDLGVPLDYYGTSMAAAHVTGVAALVLGSRIIGRHPSPDLLAAYLVRATRDLGPTGRDDDYGAGLIDAREAVSRAGAGARVRGAKRAVATAARKHRRALPIR